MKNKSLFSRLGEAFRDDDGPTDEEIVRDVESSVQAIKDAEVETLAGDDVLANSWGEAGDIVYIMNLVPIYEIIGGRTGRLANSLRESCETVFARLAGQARGRASFKDDHFFMRFASKTPSEDFRLAATVINEVGTFMLSDRFQTLDIPGLFVAADAADITNEDGSLNMERAEAAVESGGVSVSIDAPGDGSPNWMMQLWNNLSSGWGKFEKSEDIPETDYGITGSLDPLHKRDPEWQKFQSKKNSANREQTPRGKDRRTKKSSFFIGVERRKNPLGRRVSEGTGQMVW